MNYTTVATPAGPLTILVTAAGMVRAAGFTDQVTDLLGEAGPPASQQPDLGEVTKAVHAYLDGEMSALDQVPVWQPAGGDFHAEVWRVLRAVPPGTPITYTELAGLAGRPAAVRAAANACARNQVALFVPCHRVITTLRTLGGYRWGTEVKRWLLDHEQAAGAGR